MNRASAAQLLNELDKVLSTCMGARFHLNKRMKAWQSRTWFVLWLSLYGLAWFLIATLALAPGASEPKLVSLLAWGGAYFACAIYIAHDATLRIRDTIRCDIVPHAGDEYGRQVATALHKRFPRYSLLAPSIVIALLALAAAWWAIERELDHPQGLPSPEFLFWSVTYFLYFLTAAIVVIAARFYSCFAEKLPLESGHFYVLGASDTPLVRGLSRLGGQVLGFWASIFLLVLSSMLLAIIPPNGYRLASDSLLLFLMVPIAGFFSLGFGALIYLRFEARIRATVQRFTHHEARLLQEKSNERVYPSRCPLPGDADELNRLTEWQDRILAGGRYGSRAGAALSIALPFALPLLSLAISLLKVGTAASAAPQ